MPDEPPKSAALVLAAGAGRRFGGAKLLARLEDRPLLQHVLDLVADVGLRPVVVVLAPGGVLLEKAIRWRAERRVVNPVPEAGISSSLRIGLAKLETVRPRPTRALVLLADQPRLERSQLEPLLAAEAGQEQPIVVPRYADGQRGNPVLLAAPAWPLAARLSGDRGMSQLFDERPELVRYVDVPGLNPDVDTREDLAALG